MNRTHLLLLGLVLAFAAVLRAYHLSDLGYWTDELCALSDADGHGLELVDVPVDRLVPPLPVRTRLRDAAPTDQIIPGLIRTETHPPLFFLLLRGWESAFGDGEVAVRSLDVCFSVAAVALLYFAARPDIGSTAALWGCLLMAVASPQVAFAQEARDYAPALAFALAAAIAQRRLIDQPTVGRAALLAGCLLAMTLTHYYAAGVAVALAVHAGLTARGRPLVWTVAAFATAAAAFGLLWGPAFLQQAHLFRANNTTWLTDPLSGHGRRALLALCRLPVTWVADVRVPAMAWGGILFVLLPIAYWFRTRLRLWVLWLVIPTAVVTAGDLLGSTTQLTLIRFTLFATPAAYVLIAGAVRQGRSRWIPPALATVAGLLALPNAYVPAWKIDLRTPAQSVGRRLGADDGLVVSGPSENFDAITFAALQHYLPRMPAAAAVLTRPADRTVLDRLRQCPHVWVVWLWPDRPITTFLPGYETTEAGRLPSFGVVATGTVVTPSPR